MTLKKEIRLKEKEIHGIEEKKRFTILKKKRDYKKRQKKRVEEIE